MIIQGRINFKPVKVLLDIGSNVNIIPKNISQIKGQHNVEYIKTKIATINGRQMKALEDVNRRGRLRRTVRAHFIVLASFGKFHCLDMATSLERELEELDPVL
ncbi:hypothetical protein TNCV_1081871 [Trichonephila clavipes]|nr:hypothetical protein TNCV_1081871 [Trichonephila clavipes]